MKYCPTSTILRNPASIQNVLTSSCCQSIPICSSYCCNSKFWFPWSSLSKKISVLISLRTIDCPITLSGRPVVMGLIFFTHVRDWSVKTVLTCRINHAKTVSIVAWVAAKWIDSFLCPSLPSWSLDKGVLARKIGHVLSVLWTFSQIAQQVFDFTAELQRFESWEDIPLEFSRLSTDTVIVSAALRSCDPFYPFLPSFVGIWILIDLSKTQHTILKDADVRAFNIDNSFINN